MQEILDAINMILGVGKQPDALTSLEMALRTIVIYLFTLGLARLAGKRFFGEHTAFDVVFGIILGSVLSRAINGSAPVYETMVAGLVLVVMHVLFAVIAFHTSLFGDIVKGDSTLLIEDGELQWKAMRRSRISKNDLMAALRLNGNVNKPDRARLAYLERNGSISVIPMEEEPDGDAGAKPQVVELSVEEGVKIIRIELPQRQFGHSRK